MRNAIGIIGCVRDMTERQQAEGRVRKPNKDLRRHVVRQEATNKELRILMLEGVPADAELTERELRRAGLTFTARCVDTRQGFLEQLEAFSPDIVLSDDVLTDFDGLAALTIVKKRFPAIPFIIITGSANEETAVECLRAGASDYLTKDHLLRIGVAVREAIKKQRLKQEKGCMEEAARTADQEMVRLNRELPMLSECNQALVRVTNEPELLDKICRNILEIGGYRLAWVSYAEQDSGKTVRPMAIAGHDEGYVGRADISWADTERGQGLTSTAIRTGQPAICKDMLTDPNFAPWRHDAIRCGFRSSISIPLITNDQVFGALSLCAAEPGDFGYQEIEILTQLTNDLAYGIAALHIREARAQAEDALRESHARYMAVTEDAAEGILITDTKNLAIKYANPSVRRLLGYSSEELGQMSIRQIHPEADWPHVLSEFEAQTRGEKALAVSIPCLRKNGAIIFADISSAKVILDGVECMVGFFRDISERRQAEEENHRLEVYLRHQQKLETIGTLAGGVAHEINNPINGIMNYAQLIADTAGLEPSRVEFAKEIVRECERVAGIVHNLLAFARQEKQEHSPANIADIIEATLALIQTVMRHDQIVVRVDVPANLPLVKCRSQQIQQVIMNLMTNARDALNEKYPGFHEDKVIMITARRFEKDGKLWIRLTVEDHGPGIPSEIQTRVFDPFFTTKPKGLGTGIGLSISHGIIRDHGGKLHLETEVGRFTRFHMDLSADNLWSLDGLAQEVRSAQGGGDEALLLP